MSARQRLLLALIAIASFCTYSTAAQSDLRRASYSKLTFPSVGYYVIAPLDAITVPMLDQAGYYAYAHGKAGTLNVRIADGYITSFEEGAEGLVLRDNTFTPLDTIRLKGGYPVDIHEGYRLPNGNYILLGMDYRTMDLSTVIHGGKTDAQVLGAIFQELTPNQQVVFEWKSLDAIPVTETADTGYLTANIVDYIHVNSVVIDTDGNYLVSCRNLDRVIKIEKSTGKILWNLGGERSQKRDFKWLNDETDGFRGFSHQHSVFRSSKGNIVVFDNGNLKPRPNTRIVEYKLDEQDHTVEAVWSYIYNTSAYVPLMGSVTETPNGNFLVGWGGTQYLPVASEIAHDGTVVMEMQAEVFDIKPYRVYQSTFGMAGDLKYITSAGTYTFASSDSSSYVKAVIQNASGSPGLAIARHYYAAKLQRFMAKPPCSVLPMRWMVRSNNPAALQGSLVFELANLPGAHEPKALALYRRDVEGDGAFEPVIATYAAATKTLSVNKILPGEYIVGYPVCLNPSPLSPDSAATLVLTPARIAWTPAVTENGYTVEVYKGSITGSPVWTGSISGRTDTVVQGLSANTLYAWRVKAIRANSPCPWSTPFTFTTSPPFPTAVQPKVLSDTICVAANPTFKWTFVAGRSKYRLRVYELFGTTPILDTIVRDTTFKPSMQFDFGIKYEWQVRVDDGPNLSAYTPREMFVTCPDKPVMISPSDGERAVVVDNATLTWMPTPEFRDYHVQVSLDNYKTLWFDDTVRNTMQVLPKLQHAVDVSWHVRTVGRYGTSDWATKRVFTTIGEATLPSPKLISPVDNEVTAASNIELQWTKVSGAMNYIVEVSVKSGFETIAHTSRTVSGTSYTVPSLTGGTQYYWRVSAYNLTQSGGWSETNRFTVISAPSPKLTCIKPLDQAQDVPLVSYFVYSASSIYKQYSVHVAKDSLFTDRLVDTSATADSIEIHLTPGEWYWRALGERLDGRVDTSASIFFQTTGSVSVKETGYEDYLVSYRNGGLAIRGIAGIVQGVYATDISGRRYTLGSGPDHEGLYVGTSELMHGIYILSIVSNTGTHCIPICIVH